MSCGFQGNSDLFGVGIRTAYYMQIAAVWFSNYFYHREAKILRAVNKVFLLAIIIAGLVFFLNPRQYHVIEAFLLLQIGIVTGLVGITERTRYSSQYRATSKERLVIRVFIMLSGGLFNVLFWWVGLVSLSCLIAQCVFLRLYTPFLQWKLRVVIIIIRFLHLLLLRSIASFAGLGAGFATDGAFRSLDLKTLRIGGACCANTIAGHNVTHTVRRH